ncbi:hypothetical protein JCM10212_002488 [Sporobolomyces blumeae]
MRTFTQLAVASSLGLLASLVNADVVPTAPGPGDSFNEGSPCTIQWNLDTTGTWTDFTIQLMTGSNFQMTSLATVASGLDGTTGDGKYSWTCPEVDPNSAIYFYRKSLPSCLPRPQFTQAGGNTSWTTRFTIASSTGATTEPTESAVINGQTIKYGTGRLAGDSVSLASGAAAASSTGSASSNSTSGGAVAGASSAVTTSSAAAADSTSSGSSGMVTIVTSTSTSLPSSSSSSSTTDSSSTSTASRQATAAQNAATQSPSNTNAAPSIRGGSDHAVWVAGAATVMTGAWALIA